MSPGKTIPFEKRRPEAVREDSILNPAPEAAMDELTALAAFIEYSDDAIIAKGVTGIITSWNKGAEKIFGYTASEMLGTSIRRLIPADRDEEETQLLAKIRSGQRVEHFETVRLTKGGRLIHVSVASSPIKDATGRVVGVSKVARDITVRKAEEEALRLFRTLVDQSSDTFEVIDPETARFLDVNEQGPVELGCTRAEYLAMRVCDVDPTITMSTWPQLVEQIRAAGFLSGEGWHRRKDGTLFPVEVNARWVRLDRDYIVSTVRDITARRRDEEALRTSEANMAAAQHLAHLGSWEMEIANPEALDANPLRWSDEMFRIAGYEPGAVAVSNDLFFRLVPPGDHEPIRQAVAAAIREHGQYSIVHRLIRPDGMERIICETAQIFFDEKTGQPLKIIGTAHDITERCRDEEALRTSEEKYHGLFEGTRDAIMTLEPPSWKFTSGNPAAVKMFGARDEEEFLSLGPGDASPERQPDGRVSAEKAGEMIEQAMRDGSHFFEWTHRRIGGEEFPADVLLTRVEQDGKAMLHATVRDITERKHSLERFRRLVDSNAQGVIFWKTNGEIIDANDAFLQLVGYSREDLAAGRMDWADMTPPEYAGLDCHCLKEIAARGVCAPYEKEYLRKDGSRVPTLIGAASFQDNPEEGVCFVVDLTERKKLEQQFLRAQRMESIGTLAGGIAHDLNNVLGPIIMALDLLKMRFPDLASGELLDILGASAQRGADMVRQVLSFARGVEGRRMEVQVRHLVQEIEKIVHDTFLKNIQMTTCVPHDLWLVVGDPTQLHHVLLNLWVNTGEAIAEGGMLKISAENRMLDTQFASFNPEARPGPYVYVEVEDSGTGMPPEVLKKIFDPFFTTKEVGQGTGLGLSTSMAIVKSHHGFIQAYSEPEHGTKFSLYLPAQTGAFGSAPPEAVAEMPRGHGELILIVDDDTSVRQITQQTLLAFGYTVVLACDGAEAIATYATQGPKIAAVLTDMTMPIMDGIATIRVLLKMNPAVHIIGTSGLSDHGYATQAATLGVKHFLPKPYTAEVLLKALREILDEK